MNNLPVLKCSIKIRYYHYFLFFLGWFCHLSQEIVSWFLIISAKNKTFVMIVPLPVNLYFLPPFLYVFNSCLQLMPISFPFFSMMLFSALNKGFSFLRIPALSLHRSLILSPTYPLFWNVIVTCCFMHLGDLAVKFNQYLVPNMCPAQCQILQRFQGWVTWVQTSRNL